MCSDDLVRALVEFFCRRVNGDSSDQPFLALHHPIKDQALGIPKCNLTCCCTYKL